MRNCGEGEPGPFENAPLSANINQPARRRMCPWKHSEDIQSRARRKKTDPRHILKGIKNPFCSDHCRRVICSSGRNFAPNFNHYVISWTRMWQWIWISDGYLCIVTIAIVNFHQTTGCPKVHGSFEVPVISLICWPIMKPFGMLNHHTDWFGLVYNNLSHVLLTPHEHGITFEEMLK